LGYLPIINGKWTPDYEPIEKTVTSYVKQGITGKKLENKLREELDSRDEGELDPDEVIVEENKINITLHFPFEIRIDSKFITKNKKGFTRKELSEMIMKKYIDIYEKEGEKTSAILNEDKLPLIKDASNEEKRIIIRLKFIKETKGLTIGNEYFAIVDKNDGNFKQRRLRICGDNKPDFGYQYYYNTINKNDGKDFEDMFQLIYIINNEKLPIPQRNLSIIKTNTDEKYIIIRFKISYDIFLKGEETFAIVAKNEGSIYNQRRLYILMQNTENFIEYQDYFNVINKDDKVNKRNFEDSYDLVYVLNDNQSFQLLGIEEPPEPEAEINGHTIDELVLKDLLYNETSGELSLNVIAE